MEEEKPGLGTRSSGLEAKGKSCCCCTAVIGALVIVFAWWHVSWAPVALTVLGVVIMLKDVIGRCCCKKNVC